MNLLFWSVVLLALVLNIGMMVYSYRLEQARIKRIRDVILARGRRKI